jgi:ABC-type sugar transport system permease subunit
MSVIADAPKKVRQGHYATGRSRRSALQGWAYAAPTAIFVILLFLIPLALVFQMSGSDWPLLSGNQGVNLPTNYQKAVTNRFFVDSVIFTVKYTVLATVLLIGLGLGLALLVQESSRWKGSQRSGAGIRLAPVLCPLLAVRRAVRRPDESLGLHLLGYPG